MEKLDLNNVLEIKTMMTKISPKERETLDYIIKLANIRINNKGLDVLQCKEEMEMEINIEPELSDHSSDEEYEVLEHSSD
tara:strand:+ start:215 stop:454 length:240 start_codon:yes stop_codon:yes gene_type:complete